MVLPDDLIDPVIDAAGGAQFYVDAISQLTMADFIASGQYDRHIRRMRARYRRRRDALVDALAGFDVGISGLAAGVNVLLTLPDGTRARGAATGGRGRYRAARPVADAPSTGRGRQPRRHHRRFRRPRRACVRRGGRGAVRSDTEQWPLRRWC